MLAVPTSSVILAIGDGLLHTGALGRGGRVDGCKKSRNIQKEEGTWVMEACSRLPCEREEDDPKGVVML